MQKLIDLGFKLIKDYYNLEFDLCKEVGIEDIMSFQ